MPVNEASSEETPYGRYVTSDGWFVLNLSEALAVRNEQKGGSVYPLEARDAPFRDFGVNVRVFAPGQPNALYHAETGQEGFLVLSGCPSLTRHVIVGGKEPCMVLMIGARPDDETLHYPVSDVAAKYDAAAAKETFDPDEAYADWPGDHTPVRLPWPLDAR